MSNAHFTTDSILAVDPTQPFRLTVVIDNQDGQDNPANPFTLNASTGTDAAEQTSLMIDGDACITLGSIPEQLRALADAIEQGLVEGELDTAGEVTAPANATWKAHNYQGMIYPALISPDGIVYEIDQSRRYGNKLAAQQEAVVRNRALRAARKAKKESEARRARSARLAPKDGITGADIIFHCITCPDTTNTPNRALGRLAAEAWITRHRGHDVMTGIEASQA